MTVCFPSPWHVVVLSGVYPWVPTGDEGADGPPEPGPVPAVQHAAAASPGARDPAAPHAFLAHLTRLWRAGHRRRAHRHTGKTCELLCKLSNVTFSGATMKLEKRSLYRTFHSRVRYII